MDSISETAVAAADLKRARRQRATHASPAVDRLPPHSMECEQAGLGCVLLSPNECMGELALKLKARGEEFYDLRHQTIYQTMLEMYDARQPIDIITLQQRLKDKGMLEQCGGVAYLAQLQDSVPSAANLSYYLDYILDNYVARQMIHTCTDAVGRVYDYSGDILALLDEFERDALSIRKILDSSRDSVDVTTVHATLQKIYEDAFLRKTPPGLMSGFVDIDSRMGGMMEQELILVGGYPSSGKTTYMLNVAWNLMQQGVKVGLISLETSAESFIHRMAASIAKVDGKKILDGHGSQAEMDTMAKALAQIHALRHLLFLSDAGGQTGSQIAARCRQFYLSGVRFIGVDYLQLISSKSSDSYERTSGSCRDCKNIAKELKIPVMLITSLNRGAVNEDKKPTMHNIRDSGNVEYDANKVMLLYCPKDKEEEPVRPIEVIIAKAKDGPKGHVNVTMFAAQYRFANCAKVTEEDIASAKGPANRSVDASDVP